MSLALSRLILPLCIWFAFFIVGIILWVQGSKRRNVLMTILGSFFALGIIGVIITVNVTSKWDKNTYGQLNDAQIELEKLKLQQEVLRKELEDAKSKPSPIIASSQPTKTSKSISKTSKKAPAKTVKKQVINANKKSAKTSLKNKK